MTRNIKINSNGIVIFSGLVAGLSLLSLVTSKNQIFKSISATLFFSSAAVGLVTSFKASSDERNVNDQFESICQDYERERVEYKLFTDKSAQITAKLTRDLETVQDQLELAQTDLEAVQLKLRIAEEGFNLKCKELKENESTKDIRFQEFLKEYVFKTANLLIDNINSSYGSILGSCDNLLKRPEYGNIHSELLKFKESLEDPIKIHVKMAHDIAEYDINSIQTLTDCSLAAAEITTLTIQVMEEISAHRVRYRNLLNIDERRELMKFQQSEPHKISKKTAVETLREQADYDKSKLEQLEALVNEHGHDIERDRQEFMDVLKQLEKTNERIAELSQPILWTPAIVPATQTGNIIIQFFHQQRIHLDRSHYLGDKYEATLYFHTTRINPTQRIDVNQLNEHGEYLAQLTHCLAPIKFSYDYETHLLTAHLTLLKRPKKETSKEEIDSLWIPASKFENYVKKWERVRITAGSTGGKSPTAKNLALAIMNSRNGQGEIKLYDPQHGSKKDFWNMPKAGTRHEDNVTGMEELCSLLDSRSKSKGDHPFVLYIFDEVDSTIAQERGNNDYYYFRDKVTYSLKQASHQNIGCIYIGQACDASTIPGMSWSDWNNAVQLHIGANAGIWIDKAKTISSEDKTKLLQKYQKIQQYCEKMNEELGLDIFEDAGAYRFALAVPLTGLPKFIQLPAFDTYEYDEVMKSDEVSTNTQISIFPNNSEWVEISHPDELLKSKIVCPHCGSENIFKNGPTSKGEQYYSCNDCNGKPKKWRLNESTNSN